MNKHIQNATRVQEEKAPARLLLERMLGPDRVREGAPGRLVRARTALATARDLQGRELGTSALLEVDAAGTPRRLFVMDAQHKDGDTMLVDTAMGRYLVTVSKTQKGLDGKGYIFAGGEASVLELKLESAMVVRGEMQEDPYNWGDIAHADEFNGIRKAIEGNVQELTAEQMLRAKFVFRDKTEITGAELFGCSVELKTGHIRLKYRDGEFRADVLWAENAEHTIKLALIQRNVEELPDIEARFAGEKRKPLAFKAEIEGYVYAGVMV